MDNILTDIKEKVDCNRLFRVGPFNRFNNAERIELPSSEESSVQDITQKAISIITEEIASKEFYVILVFEEYNDELTKEEVELARECGVDIDKPIGSYNFYDDDDDLYCFVRAYHCNESELEVIIKGKLARHFDLEPYFMAELFILSSDFKTIINLYDERGLDIVWINQ